KESDVARRALVETIGDAGGQEHRLDRALGRQQPRLDHHLEEHLSKLLVREVRDCPQLVMPHGLRAVEGVVVLVGDGARQGKEALTQDFLGELADEFVTATRGYPHEVAAFSRGDIAEDLNLMVEERRHPLDGLSHATDTRATGPSLKEVLLDGYVAHLRPVAMLDVHGRQNCGLPLQKATSRERQRVARRNNGVTVHGALLSENGILIRIRRLSHSRCSDLVEALTAPERVERLLDLVPARVLRLSQ